MAQQSKSYRYGKPMAPYKQRVVASNASNGPSFFRKMKSLFSHEQGPNNSRHQRRKSEQEHTEASSPRIPGGFFTGEVSTHKVTTAPANLHRFDDVRNMQSNMTQSIQGDESDDESQIANTSNAKLADFFSKKGDAPLTDIEMEGVLSLMKKASRSGTTRKRPLITTDFDDSTTLESSRVLKSSRTPSMIASSHRAPSFTPRYDDSVGSQSLGNASLRSSSSRRRVFDYSSFPTPYKTVVYKYSAADGTNGSRVGSTAVASEASSNEVALSSRTYDQPTQKLSNTASALVSLLDGKPADRGLSSLCSNPYSSYIEPIRDYKKTVSASHPSKNPAPSNNLRSEALEKIQGAKDEPVSQILPKQRQKVQQKPSSEKYKPVRSSSLRSSIVPAEEVGKNADDHEESMPTVPTATGFNFTFKSNDKEGVQTDVRISNQPLPTAPSQPQSIEIFDQSMDETKAKETDNKTDHTKKFFAGIKQSNHSESSGQQVKDGFGSQSKAGVFSQKAAPEPKKFDFGEPLPSKVDPEHIDGAKVEGFKSLFVF